MVATKTLQVLMNGIRVGTLQRLSGNTLQFKYNESWRAHPGARPVSLSLPLRSDIFTGDKVYNFFDNLLPDNSQIRARIQAQFHASTDSAFDLLSYIGRDCIGAIQLLDESITLDETSVRQIKAQALTSKKIATLLRHYATAPLGMTPEKDNFRISIAGAQEKSAFLFYEKKWCRPLDTTPTTHIFKLPIGIIAQQNIDLSDSCENEWLCLQVAKAYGLPTAACEIKHFEDQKVLVVERFDRQLAENGSWIMRLPQEDCCQALGYSSHLKYQADGGPGILEIMNLLLGSHAAKKDRQNFLKTQILFLLLAAIDGHAKNFSLFIQTGGRYQSTPLYDILSAHPLLASKQLQKQKIKMAMALKGKSNHYLWDTLQRRHLLNTAQAAHYSAVEAEQCLDQMLEQLDNVINTVEATLPASFPSRIAKPIFKGMKGVRNRLSRNKR